jgi:hypothetical protein
VRILRRKIRNDKDLTEAASTLAEAFDRADEDALVAALEAQDLPAIQAALGLSEAQLNRLIELFEGRVHDLSRYPDFEELVRRAS